MESCSKVTSSHTGSNSNRKTELDQPGSTNGRLIKALAKNNDYQSTNTAEKIEALVNVKEDPVNDNNRKRKSPSIEQRFNSPLATPNRHRNNSPANTNYDPRREKDQSPSPTKTLKHRESTRSDKTSRDDRTSSDRYDNRTHSDRKDRGYRNRHDRSDRYEGRGYEDKRTDRRAKYSRDRGYEGRETYDDRRYKDEHDYQRGELNRKERLSRKRDDQLESYERNQPTRRQKRRKEEMDDRRNVPMGRELDEQNNLVPDRTYTIMEPYMTFIRRGVKSAEGRVNSRGYDSLAVGQIVYFHNRQMGILCRITHVNRYESFEAMLRGEGVGNMLPQFDEQKREQIRDLLNHNKLKNLQWSAEWDTERCIQEGATQIYKKFPGWERVKASGAVAIGVEYIKNHTTNQSVGQGRKTWRK
jgi:ASC-1-like (ASCH) protein